MSERASYRAKSNRSQDELRVRIRAAEKLTQNALVHWEALCFEAGLVEPPNSYELGRAARIRIAAGGPLHPTDHAYAAFVEKFNAEQLLVGELARRDDPRRREPMPGPMYRKIKGERVRIYRLWETYR